MINSARTALKKIINFFRTPSKNQFNVSNNKVLLSSIGEGSILTGMVINISNYGLKVDLGGVIGMVKPVPHSLESSSHDHFNIRTGSTVKVEVLEVDTEKSLILLNLQKLSLGTPHN